VSAALDAYTAFRSRDFRLLLSGTFLTNFGLQMLSVAVSWDLYMQTHSALVLGNVGFVQVAPFLLFALFAGHVADRYDRRRVMLVTQVLLLAGSALLAFAPRTVTLIYTCLFLIQMARALQGPARQAMLPEIVSMDALSNAITWHTSAFEIASVTGPALAGILVASAGSSAVYMTQVGCAALTLGCVWMLHYRGKGTGEAVPVEGRSLLEGLRFVWRSKLVLPAISLDLFAVLFGGATALLPIFAVDILHAGARGLGWLRAASSIGAILMAFLQAHAGPLRRSGLVLLWCVAGFGAATVVFGFSRSLWLSLVMLMVLGGLDNVSVVLRQSLVQKKTPDAVRGRVLAVNSIFISCSNQLGAVESGWTAAWFGAVPSVVGGGIATMLIVAAFAIGSRELREWTQ
jgi:MFS family permease